MTKNEITFWNYFETMFVNIQVFLKFILYNCWWNVDPFYPLEMKEQSEQKQRISSGGHALKKAKLLHRMKRSWPQLLGIYMMESLSTAWKREKYLFTSLYLFIGSNTFSLLKEDVYGVIKWIKRKEHVANKSAKFSE